MIKTLPRIGFYIAAEFVSRNEEKPQAVEISTPSNVPPSGWLQRYKLAILSISVLISLLLVIHALNFALRKQDYVFPQSTLYKIGMVETCPVYSLNNSSPEIAARKVQIAQQLSTSHANCIGNSVFIFQLGKHYMEQEKGRVFIARCTYDANTPAHYSDCRGVYVYTQQ